MRRVALRSLQVRLLLMLVLVSIAVVAVAVYSGIRQHQLLADETRTEAIASARLVSNFHQDKLREATHLLSTIAAIPVVRRGPPEEAEGVLAAVADRGGDHYTSIVLVNSEGRLLTPGTGSLETSATFNDRSWFQSVVETKRCVHGELVISRVSGRPVTVVACPILDENNNTARIIAAGLTLNWIERFRMSRLITHNTTVAIMDRRGAVIAVHPADSPLFSSSNTRSEVAKAVSRGATGAFSIDVEGGSSHFIGHAPLESTPSGVNDIVVVAGIPAGDLMGRTDRALISATGLLIVVATVGIVLFWIGTRYWVLRPLTTLIAATRRMEEGNLETRVGAPYPHGEIGELAAHFDSMAERLEARQQRLETELFWSDILNRISKSIAEHQTTDSIFRVVIYHLAESFNASEGSLSSRDGDLEYEQVRVLFVQDPELGTGLQDLEGSTIACKQQQVIENFDPNTPVSVALEDEEAVSRLPGAYSEGASAARDAGMRSVVFLPVGSDTQHLATAWLVFRHIKVLTEYEISFLSNCAQLISLAIQQSRAHDELKAAYEELKSTRQAATRQERLNAMGQMASGIAHDINNSLMPITSYIDVLLQSEEDLSDRATRLLNTMRKAAWSISDATARMKKFYKKEGDTERTYIDVKELFDTVLDLTQPRWRDVPQEQGIAIETTVEVESDLSPLYAAESEVRESLTNLIFNAVDAMPEGGQVRLIATSQDAEHVVLTVEDSGTGMTEEEQEKSLEPFHTSKGAQGTGMGLATVYGTMQRHGGNLRIQSTKGHGTSVSLEFPVTAAEVTNRAREKAPASIPPLHILCVDDDPTVLQSLRDMLEMDEHTVETADGGTQALELINQAQDDGLRFDTVITDLGMPHVDGREVAGAVKRMSPETPVILLSGWRSQIDPDEPDPKNVDSFLGKPPQLSELRNALRIHFSEGEDRTYEEHQ